MSEKPIQDKSITAKPRLCVDIDNVIAQTDEVMRRVIREFTKGRVNYNYDHILEFDYHKCVDSAGESSAKGEWKGIHELFSEPDNILSIAAMPGALENLKRLSDSFDVHLATTRLPKARRATIEWLETNGFPPFDLHFLRHGEKHVSLAPFFAAVEDHYEQAVTFVEAGSPCFLIEHPWNRTKARLDGIQWVKDWDQLADRLFEVARALGFSD
jgi:5'(3')-deoxyribonucleotidase